MNKDYETPNFKTPPKKPIFTISKSAIRLTSTPNSSNHDEISLEDVEKKIYEIVTNAVNSGLTNQKIEEIKERAYKDIIKNQKFSINRLVKEQDRLVKIVQENLDEKINQKHQEIQNQFKDNNSKSTTLLEDHKLLKEKYSRLKAKFIQMDTKIKALLSEKDKINSEKMQLQEKNHTYLQDATRLHQLSEEMKEFENKVHIKKIFQLEKNIANLEIENKTLKSSFHEQIKPKSNILLEQNDNLNIKENKGRFENKIEKLIKENNKLVISMQSALDSCSNIKIPDINTNDHIINSTTDVPNKDLKELLIKIDRLLNENEILKNQDKTKDLLITELREKLDKKDGFYQIKEDFSDIGKKNNETIKFLEERLKAKENEVHSLEIRLKFFEENEVKLKSQLQTQLEFKNKDRNDSNVLETMQMKINELELKNSRVQHDYYNRNDDFLDSSKRRNFEVENEINELKKINEEIKKSFNESNSEKIRLKEMIEKQKLDFELEKELRNQYFINIKELEAILRDLMNEGDMFRHHIKKTISEENQKILEKYRILLEEKPSE